MVDLPPPIPPQPPEPETPPAAEAAPEAEEALEATCLGAEPGADATEPPEPPAADEPDEAPEALAPDDDGEAAPAPERRRRNAFTAIEIAAQIHQVQEWLTEGRRPNQVRQLCSDEWGLNSRVAEARMHEARKQMVLDVNAYERKDMAAKMLQSLEKVLEQALKTNQGSNAIGAMKLQADLLQLIARQN